MSNKKSAEPEFGQSRKILFRIITLTFPILFLLLIEGGLRLFRYGNTMDLFIENPTEGYEDYLIVNPEIGRKYFRKLEYTIPPNDIFLKEKSPETFRIFVMGSSTVIGFPYEYNLMFSRILHKRLQDAYPARNIEVVNTAITAINSYSLEDMSREIVKYKPDAVLIYAGHNEFYGAFGIGSNESMSKSRMLTRLHFRLMDLRIYQFMRNMIGSLVREGGTGEAEDTRGTLMKRIVGNKCIPYESDDYRLAMERYRQNMGDVLERMERNQIPVFCSDVISNIRNIKPFSYISTGKEDEAWEKYLEGARAYNEGEYNRALENLEQAKDLDCVRFRASGQLNSIVEELTGKYNAYPVPMHERFQAVSPHGIIGDNLLTEHVHPNIDGNFLMADEFFRVIIGSGIIGQTDRDDLYPSSYYKKNWGYTALDSLLAMHRINNLKNYWPFSPLNTNRTDYRETYTPKSYLDSLAFITFRDSKHSLQEARFDLARSYEKEGLYADAYREYEAILRTNPYMAANYRDAATALINLGDLPLALQYFKHSLQYKKTFYAFYRIGEIYLIKGDNSHALNNFVEAFSLTEDNSDKIRTLGKIYMACVYGNFSEKAAEVADQLQKAGAVQSLRIPPKSYTYTRYIPFQTREQVQQALGLINEGNLDEALKVLQNSLAIYDSHIARRYIGEIYLRLDDRLQALYQFNRIYEEFMFDPVFLQNLISINISTGNYSTAENELNELRKIEPLNPSISIFSKLLLKEKKEN